MMPFNITRKAAIDGLFKYVRVNLTDMATLHVEGHDHAVIAIAEMAEIVGRHSEYTVRLSYALDDGASAVDHPIDYEDSVMKVYFDRRRLRVRGIQKYLTPTTFNVLAAIIHAYPQPISRRDISMRVWGREVARSYLAAYIGDLRRAIEEDPQFPQSILAVEGFGYVLIKR